MDSDLKAYAVFIAAFLLPLIVIGIIFSHSFTTRRVMSSLAASISSACVLTAYYLIPEGDSLEAMFALVIVGIPNAFALFPILFRLSSIAVLKLRIPADLARPRNDVLELTIGAAMAFAVWLLFILAAAAIGVSIPTLSRVGWHTDDANNRLASIRTRQKANFKSRGQGALAQSMGQEACVHWV